MRISISGFRPPRGSGISPVPRQRATSGSTLERCEILHGRIKIAAFVTASSARHLYSTYVKQVDLAWEYNPLETTNLLQTPSTTTKTRKIAHATKYDDVRRCLFERHTGHCAAEMRGVTSMMVIAINRVCPPNGKQTQNIIIIVGCACLCENIRDDQHVRNR